MSKQTAQYFAGYYAKNRIEIARKRKAYRARNLLRLMEAERGYFAKYRAKHHAAILARAREPERQERKNQKSREHYRKNVAAIRRKHAEYYWKNRAKINAVEKIRYGKNRILIAKKAATRWRENKANMYPRYLAWRRQKRATDPTFVIRCNLSTRIYDILKKRRCSKSRSTIQLLGCTIPDLVKHLQEKFIEGMSWENYGKWHVDHIKPCAAFRLSDPEEQRKCFHYLNLQPLWAADNLRKSDQYSLTRA